MPPHSFFAFGFYKRPFYLAVDGKRPSEKVSCTYREAMLRNTIFPNLTVCGESVGRCSLYSVKRKLLQKGLCCPVDGLMQPWCNTCCASPSADIIIIVLLLIIIMYLFCSAFAEQQGSAMPETVPLHTETGSW